MRMSFSALSDVMHAFRGAVMARCAAVAISTTVDTTPMLIDLP